MTNRAVVNLEVYAYGDVVVDGLGLVVTVLLERREVGLEVVAYVELTEVNTNAEVETKLEDASVTVLLLEQVSLNVITLGGLPLCSCKEVEFEVRTEERNDLHIGRTGKSELIY